MADFDYVAAFAFWLYDQDKSGKQAIRIQYDEIQSLTRKISSLESKVAEL
jgi:hypothetical protein